ncbi:MAG: hypothetical protein AABZ77_04235, partial [Chloroflexota bacterium]
NYINQLTVSTGTITLSASITIGGTAAQTKVTFSGAGTLNIGRDFLVAPGAFTASTGTVNYNGAATAQTIANLDYYNLGFSGAHTNRNITINGAVGVAGALTNTATFTSGNFVLTSSTFNFNGTGAQTIISLNSVTYPALTINKASGVATLGSAVTATAFTLTTGTFDAATFLLTFTTPTFTAGTLRVGGATWATNYSGAITQPAGGTIEYYAAGAQTVNAITYPGNLTLSGSGSKTTTGVTVNGILSMEGTAAASVAPTYGASATLQYNTATARTASVEWITPFAATGGVIIASTGNITLNESKVFNASIPLTINSGAKLNAASFQITIPGAFTATGTFNADTGTVSYTGASQTIAPVTYNNLTINQSSGNATLGGNATVTGTLTLTAGKIITGSNTLIISSSGSISGASSARYVFGNLQKYAATGATSITFEVGKASSYDPVTIAFGNVTVAGTLTANVTDGQHANIASSTLNSSKDVTEYWTLTNSGISFDSYSATFTFVAADIGGSANTSQFFVGKYSGGWTYPTMGARTSTTTQATGLTSFSDFVVGEMTITWLSYNDTARTIADDNFTAGENTVYMFGQGFLFSHTYTVGYYDGTVSGGGQKVASDSGLTSGTSGNLSSQYLLTTDFNAVAGTWHSVAFEPGLGIPSDNYTAALASPALVANHAFEVAASAIPEFPTVIAAIMVAGSSFGLYYWMRKRASRKISHAFDSAG